MQPIIFFEFRKSPIYQITFQYNKVMYESCLYLEVCYFLSQILIFLSLFQIKFLKYGVINYGYVKCINKLKKD